MNDNEKKMSSTVEGEKNFDLDWDDGHVIPKVVFPDLAFFFDRLSEATLEAIDPRSGEMILDVGCGRANDAVILAERGGNCFGLEPSETMIYHAKKEISKNGRGVALIRGIGECIPIRASSFDKVVCKGALDHFHTPERALEEMARIVKPGGRVVITIANLDSLGFRLGRTFFVRFRKLLRREESIYEKIWQTPFDHSHRFGYRSLKVLAERHLNVERCIGVSLFFASPWWGMILSKLPKPVSYTILRALDRIARWIPSLSDGVVMVCTPKADMGKQN